ncbi:predicted protein [Nematostella vectensis]|uniref:Cysteine-rich DPF motif domain-containing protein 1 n=1 Tax=Nematostella vectensis TaxID=45351 RepID=A7RIP9_NEMVE|nr:predicted protein [Nematostella vectensis]|eukprot:XP_001640900.1 predicted protein [Nematostella vectensis]
MAELQGADRVDAEEENERVFACSLCDFNCRYEYFGNKPPFSQAVLLLEKAYVIKDPFSPNKVHLTIGGVCCLCSKNVCIGQNCSIFYTKRFCVPCVKDNIADFPSEIQSEVVNK